MCPDCTDPNGEACYPQYGVAPHTCFYKIPGAIIGESVLLPEEEWPDTFIPDPAVHGLGTWICPTCREMPRPIDHEKVVIKDGRVYENGKVALTAPTIQVTKAAKESVQLLNRILSDATYAQQIGSLK